jgi:hypothetical protein
MLILIAPTSFTVRTESTAQRSLYVRRMILAPKYRNALKKTVIALSRTFAKQAAQKSSKMLALWLKVTLLESLKLLHLRNQKKK